MSFRFDRLHAGDETHRDSHGQDSRGRLNPPKKQDATRIGIGIGAGAVIGAIAGGGKGAAIGSAIGAGAGTGVVMSTRGKEVRLPAGTAVKTTPRRAGYDPSSIGLIRFYQAVIASSNIALEFVSSCRAG